MHCNEEACDVYLLLEEMMGMVVDEEVLLDKVVWIRYVVNMVYMQNI